MAGDGEHTKAAWRRVGLLLKRRRPQLDPRYRVRRIFAEEKNLRDKTVQEIENAYRTSFTEEMLAAFETAYQLAPGSIRQALGDPALTEFPGKLDSPAPKPAMRAPSATDMVFVPGDLVLGELEPWEAHLWHTPQLSVDDRRTLIEIERRILNGRARGGST